MFSIYYKATRWSFCNIFFSFFFKPKDKISSFAFLLLIPFFQLLKHIGVNFRLKWKKYYFRIKYSFLKNILFPRRIHSFKVKYGNTRIMCEIGSKLTIRTSGITPMTAGLKLQYIYECLLFLLLHIHCSVLIRLNDVNFQLLTRI